RRCDSCQSQGEKKTDSPTHLKVANRSGLVAEGSPARAGAQRSERKKGGVPAPGDSKGRSPWRAFGDFLRDGNVTRGRRGGAPSPWGSWGRLAPTWDLRCVGTVPSQFSRCLFVLEPLLV